MYMIYKFRPSSLMTSAAVHHLASMAFVDTTTFHRCVCLAVYFMAFMALGAAAFMARRFMAAFFFMAFGAAAFMARRFMAAIFFITLAALAAFIAFIAFAIAGKAE